MSGLYHEIKKDCNVVDNMPAFLTGLIRRNHLPTQRYLVDYTLLQGLQPPEHYKKPRMEKVNKSYKEQGLEFAKENPPLVIAVLKNNLLEFYVVDGHHVARGFGEFRRREYSSSGINNEIPCEVVLIDQLADLLGFPVSSVIQQIEDDASNSLAAFEAKTTKAIRPRSLEVKSNVPNRDSESIPTQQVYNLWESVAAKLIGY